MVMDEQSIFTDSAEMNRGSFLPVAINLLFVDLFYAELTPQSKLSGSM